jgi:HTH-type transcriptional regulator/antitoxin HipB
VKITSPQDLAAAVRGRRLSLGLSQEDLARQAEVSRPWLSDVEAGKPTTQFGRVIRLLDALSLELSLEVREDKAEPNDLDALLAAYGNQ